MKKSILTISLLWLGFAAFGQSTVDITFNVNMNFQVVDSGGVFVAGGSGFGSPGDNELTDPDGDGIYSITLSKPDGFGSHYIFLNGNCGDWSCKEQIGGQPCSDPANFGDRYIQLGTNDTTVSTCFGLCTDDTNCSAIDSVNVTFNLDMNGLTVDTSGVYIAGGAGFNGPGDNRMTDPDGDGIYSITLGRPANFSSHYTFLNGNCGDYSCKEDISGQACADPNSFNDRFISLGSNDTTVCTAFAQCVDVTPCFATGIHDLLIDPNLFQVQPNRVYGITALVFSGIVPGIRQVDVIDISGRIVKQQTVSGSVLNHSLKLQDLTPGLYFVKVSQQDKLGIQKIQIME